MKEMKGMKSETCSQTQQVSNDGTSTEKQRSQLTPAKNIHVKNKMQTVWCYLMFWLFLITDFILRGITILLLICTINECVSESNFGIILSLITTLVLFTLTQDFFCLKKGS